MIALLQKLLQGLLLYILRYLGYKTRKPYVRGRYDENYFTSKLINGWNFNSPPKISNGLRADMSRGSYIIEVDWCKKYYEAIGQALFYSYYTGKKPAIVFLIPKGTELDHRVPPVLKNLGIKYWTVHVDKPNGTIINVKETR